MPDVLIEDELKELLAKCENIVPEENYVVDECTKERDKEFELAKKAALIFRSMKATNIRASSSMRYALDWKARSMSGFMTTSVSHGSRCAR